MRLVRSTHVLPVTPASPNGPSLLDGIGADALDTQVRAAQADMVFERARVANWLGTPVAALVCWVLWDAMPHAWLLAWLAAKLARNLVDAMPIIR